MQRARWYLLALVTFLLVAQRAGVAHAGPVEQLHQLLFQPGEPDVRVLRYDNGGDGLFYTRDGGSSWKLACVSSIDATLTHGGTLALSSDGTTLMGMFDGMWQDDGKGCGWSKIAMFDGTWISSFALDPIDGKRMFAVSSTAGKMNGIFARAADGTWSELGSRDEVLINSIHATNVGGKLRFYEGVLKGMKTSDAGTALPNYVLRVSDDEGKTWEEHVFDDAGNNTLRIQAVDPTNPDRIVATIDRQGEPDSVLVSDDKAASFTEYMKLSSFGGLAFAPDGRVWIGEAGDIANQDASQGLWAAKSLDEPAKKIAEYVTQCVAFEPTASALYVCQHWFLGTADPATGKFESSFKLTEAKDFVSCDGVDMPAACQTQLCAAYCGPMHFAQAPLCTAYSDPNCGPAVADDSGGGSGGASGASRDAGTSTASGTGGAGAAPASGTGGASGGPTTAAGSGGMQSANGTGGGDSGDHGDGGCSIGRHSRGATGDDSRSSAPTSIAIIALALGYVLRRHKNV